MENDAPNYIPPIKLILAGLGITEPELSKPTVNISTAYLKRLIRELPRNVRVDDDWYTTEYKDIGGAIMARVIPTARDHFIETGYFEGRVPAEMPFDHRWYRDHYEDLALVFNSTDEAGLRAHYLTRGYFEGRAGVPDCLEEANKWNPTA